MIEEYEEDYEGELDLEEAGYEEDSADESSNFEQEYDKIFSEDKEVEEDVESFELDAVTGRKAKRPKMSLLNKSKLTKQELDELFLNE